METYPERMMTVVGTVQDVVKAESMMRKKIAEIETVGLFIL